ncbi:BTB/POZ and MATH domain-containing protein 1-like [Setaria italica]|uniref:BTB/POZ and MATH domain-containing protein 1-like n=1 Tax=Setaria italica TaxID=4555 RepID=UPI0003508507|nr:BTB/POZ and MATH domain-containing protein 1-like [Setaria italica]
MQISLHKSVNRFERKGISMNPVIATTCRVLRLRSSTTPACVNLTDTSRSVQLLKINGFTATKKAPRDELDESRYLKDECIVVQLQSCSVKERMQRQLMPHPVFHRPTCTTNLVSCCGSARRCVLAARSTVFMAELFGDMKDNSSACIEVKDMEVEVFRAMLYFIYTDTVPELEDGKIMY